MLVALSKTPNILMVNMEKNGFTKNGFPRVYVWQTRDARAQTHSQDVLTLKVPYKENLGIPTVSIVE